MANPGMFNAPNSRQRPTDYKVFSQAAPVAGSEIIITVPAKVVWRLVTFAAQLVTSAVVGNRQLSIVVDDGTNILHRSGFNGSTAVVASQSPFCEAAFLGAATGGISNVMTSQAMLPSPDYFLLLPGWRIRTLTFAALDAGDQWGIPRCIIDEIPTQF